MEGGVMHIGFVPRSIFYSETEDLDMASIVIGIHGLSKKPQADTLSQWWLAAMQEGLEVNTGRRLEALAFESVYWADVMYPEPDNNPDAYKAAQPGTIKSYKEGWLEKLKDSITQEVGKAVDVFKQTFGIEKIAEKVLDKKLSDLYRYYEEPAIRNELRSRLKETIKRNRNKRIMIVAHSMGTIIAYDTLRIMGAEDASLKIDHFVTIGSPLGLPHVKLRIAEENSAIRTPSCVQKWTNFSDRLDPVALDPRLADDYAANDRGVKVRDDLVLNDWGGIHHKSYGYLRTPEFTEELKNFV